MPHVKEINSLVEKLAPPQLADSWDNTGLIINCNNITDKILVALDVTDEVISEAEALGCGVIVSHHPVLFNDIKRLCHTDIAFKLIQKGISSIAAHTNLDEAEGGVSDTMADIFGLTDVIKYRDAIRIGTLSKTLTIKQLSEKCSKLYKQPIKYILGDNPVKRLAVVGGAGCMVNSEIASMADCILTGEAKHHDVLDAKLLGFGVIACGHFATEHHILSILAQRLEQQLKPVAEIYISQNGKDPFCYI